MEDMIHFRQTPLLTQIAKIVTKESNILTNSALNAKYAVYVNKQMAVL